MKKIIKKYNDWQRWKNRWLTIKNRANRQQRRLLSQENNLKIEALELKYKNEKLDIENEIADLKSRLNDAKKEIEKTKKYEKDRADKKIKEIEKSLLGREDSTYRITKENLEQKERLDKMESCLLKDRNVVMQRVDDLFVKAMQAVERSTKTIEETKKECELLAKQSLNITSETIFENMGGLNYDVQQIEGSGRKSEIH